MFIFCKYAIYRAGAILALSFGGAWPHRHPDLPQIPFFFSSTKFGLFAVADQSNISVENIFALMSSVVPPLPERNYKRVMPFLSFLCLLGKVLFTASRATSNIKSRCFWEEDNPWNTFCWTSNFLFFTISTRDRLKIFRSIPRFSLDFPFRNFSAENRKWKTEISQKTESFTDPCSEAHTPRHWNWNRQFWRPPESLLWPGRCFDCGFLEAVAQSVIRPKSSSCPPLRDLTLTWWQINYLTINRLLRNRLL